MASFFAGVIKGLRLRGWAHVKRFDLSLCMTHRHVPRQGNKYHECSFHVIITWIFKAALIHRGESFSFLISHWLHVDFVMFWAFNCCVGLNKTWIEKVFHWKNRKSNFTAAEAEAEAEAEIGAELKQSRLCIQINNGNAICHTLHFDVPFSYPAKGKGCPASCRQVKNAAMLENDSAWNERMQMEMKTPLGGKTREGRGGERMGGQDKPRCLNMPKVQPHCGSGVNKLIQTRGQGCANDSALKRENCPK